MAIDLGSPWGKTHAVNSCMLRIVPLRKNSTVSPRPTMGSLFLLMVAVIGAVAALGQIALHVFYFLSPRAFLWDAGIYLAMGRGLLNGLTLYKDIFDLKPPGVFFLSALSLALFGDGRLGNIFGALALLVFPLSTVLFVRPALLHTRGRTRMTLALLALLLGAFWSSFQAMEGGPWQTEPFGAVFALLYTVSLFLSSRHRVWQLSLAVIGLMGSIGMKEPFVFSCAAAALLTSPTPKEFLKRFVVPLIVTCVIGVIVMGALGILLPYISYYLPSLMLYRGWDFDPVWMRGLGGNILMINIAKVSPVAPLAFLLLVGLGLFARLQHIRMASRKVWTVLSTVLALYIAMLSMGIAGDYQSHHFVFMAPAFFALCFILLQKTPALLQARATRFAVLGLLTVLSLVFLIPTHLPDPRYAENRYREIVTSAAILDSMLDECGIDRYLSVIGPEVNIYGFTLHSPLNHSLFWQIDNAIQYGQTFLDLSIERLGQSDVIVLPKEGFTPSSEIGNDMAAYIAEAFSPVRPTCAQGMPDLPGHTLLFRRNNTPLKLEIKFIDSRK
ncbi:hypothetical protein HYZ99_02530 [Candidatus Peregrinibacteria bacterium]|nr:hypothetical protein [Candidatus Peregrinibacteria bacterium]